MLETAVPTMWFRPLRTRAFVDGQNLLSALHNNFEHLPLVDFRALQKIMADGTVPTTRPRFYLSRHASRRTLLRVAPYFWIERCFKDADTLIAADCMEQAEETDAINLCTADCDAIDLISRLHDRGIIVTLILCTLQTPIPDLLRAADRVVLFEPGMILGKAERAA